MFYNNMKNTSFYITFVLVLALLGLGCQDSEEKDKSFEITFITGKIEGAKYPREIFSFLFPLKSDSCLNINFKANVTIERLDLGSVVKEKLEAPQNQLAKGVGQVDDEQEITQKFNNSVKIPEIFLKANGQLDNGKLNNIIKQFPIENVYAFTSNSSDISNKLNGNILYNGMNIKFFNSMDVLQKLLLKNACGDKVEKFLILYNFEEVPTTHADPVKVDTTTIIRDQIPNSIKGRKKPRKDVDEEKHRREETTKLKRDEAKKAEEAEKAKKAKEDEAKKADEAKKTEEAKKAKEDEAKKVSEKKKEDMKKREDEARKQPVPTELDKKSTKSTPKQNNNF
jgi:hypothetical protein